ncbi:MAG: hypothetical protein HY898_12405 [Deltaproteobacteria bacterium]|nr:hypothetical protein [Deltaproteobacteria bacterium]
MRSLAVLFDRRAILGALLLATASACGARTGLKADPVEESDAAPAAVDASKDALSDAKDAASEPLKDAVSEDAIPPIDASKNDGQVPSDCPDAASTLVYLLSSEQGLLSFDPPTLAFKTIGNIACPSSFSQPNSMAVDRTGIAYSVFMDGTLWRISTGTAKCQATSYEPNQLGFLRFGMAFVASQSIDELYVVEASYETDSKGLALLDTESLKLSFVGGFEPPLPTCELTGTGDGRLFALCLNWNGGSTLSEIDKKTAKILGSDSLATGGAMDAFAFAFWGGSLWIFDSPDTDTVVVQYDPVTKIEKQVTTLANTRIVGAGVSTCAPL